MSTMPRPGEPESDHDCCDDMQPTPRTMERRGNIGVSGDARCCTAGLGNEFGSLPNCTVLRPMDQLPPREDDSAWLKTAKPDIVGLTN